MLSLTMKIKTIIIFLTLLSSSCSKILIEINSNPDSDVYIDNTKYQTPLKIKLEKDKPISIIFEKEHYITIENEYTFTNKKKGLSVNLHPENVKFSINCNAANAEYFLDENNIKNNSSIIPGEYTLTVKTPNHADYRKKIIIKLGEDFNKDIELIKLQNIKFKDSYGMTIAPGWPLYSDYSEESKLLKKLSHPVFYELLEKSPDGKWSKIKTNNGAIGWTKMGIRNMEKDELDKFITDFYSIEYKLDNLLIPTTIGNVTEELIVNKTFGPLNNNFGYYWHFNDDGTLYSFDNTSGVGADIGHWKIRNGYLVANLYGLFQSYGSASPNWKMWFYWNYEIDNTLPYNDIKITNQNGYSRYTNDGNPPNKITVNETNYEIEYKEINIRSNNKLYLYSEPNLNSKKIEIYNRDKEMVQDYLPQNSKIIKFFEMNNSDGLWYYLDTNTEDWLAPDNYHFAWVNIK